MTVRENKQKFEYLIFAQTNINFYESNISLALFYDISTVFDFLPIR